MADGRAERHTERVTSPWLWIELELIEALGVAEQRASSHKLGMVVSDPPPYRASDGIVKPRRVEPQPLHPFWDIHPR